MERMSEKGRPPRSHEVGYCKPPKHARFRPGQSGNPKGRRKQSKSAKALLTEALNERVLVTEAGVRRRITKLEAFWKSLVARALHGDARSTALLMKVMEQHNLASDGNVTGEIRIVLVDPPPRPDDELLRFRKP
jgi:predicted DNA-binding ribbon-helix-helix protein